MTLTIYDAADIPQGSDAWLEARRGIVTASTVGKLLTSTGKIANNDTSRALTETLVAERLTGRIEYVHPTRDMERGTILEPFARDVYAQHYNPVQEVGFMVREDHGHRIGFSPDGLLGDVGFIEIKSRTPRIQINTFRRDDVPAVNIPQIQCGLFVSGREFAHYVSYCPGLPLFVREVTPDPKWQDAIAEAWEKFEDAATEMERQYRTSSAASVPTEYFDPFDTGEEIY